LLSTHPPPPSYSAARNFKLPNSNKWVAKGWQCFPAVESVPAVNAREASAKETRMRVCQGSEEKHLRVHKFETALPSASPCFRVTQLSHPSETAPVLLPCVCQCEPQPLFVLWHPDDSMTIQGACRGQRSFSVTPAVTVGISEARTCDA